MIDTNRDKDILKNLKGILHPMLAIPTNLSDTINTEADSTRITSEKVTREEKNILEMNLNQLIAKIVKSIKETTSPDQTIALMISLEMKELQGLMTDDFDRYLFIIIMIHHHLTNSWIEFSH